jgi:hypothetical protein
MEIKHALVAHADWSVAPGKRWLALATRRTTDPAIRRVEGWIMGQLKNKEKDGQNEPQ